MPSARQDLFIMGFIHIYKFASNKCTVLKLAHFIASRKKNLQLYSRFFECELHVCIIHTHKRSLIQMECAPQHVCAHTQINSVLGILSLWGFLTRTTVNQNGVKSLGIDRLSSADPGHRVLGAMECETMAQNGKGWLARRRRKECHCGPWQRESKPDAVMHVCNPSTWAAGAGVSVVQGQTGLYEAESQQN